MIIQIKNKMKKNFYKVILKFKVQLYKKLNLRSMKIVKKKKKFLRNNKINRMNLKFQFKIKIKNQNYLQFKLVKIKLFIKV